jgi:ParB family chromosome partitioning protein
MRLLSLPDDVKEFLNDGRLTTGHARAILTAPEPITAANEVIKKNLSVRQTENFVKKLSSDEGRAVVKKNYSRKKKGDDIYVEQVAAVAVNGNAAVDNVIYLQQSKEPEIMMMEKQLTESLGLNVMINDAEESGVVLIKYGSMEELGRIIEKLEG